MAEESGEDVEILGLERIDDSVLWTRQADYLKNILKWLRNEAQAITRYAQFRLRGYGYRIEQYETKDEIVIIIHIPLPSGIRKALEEYFGKPKEVQKYGLETGD